MSKNDKNIICENRKAFHDYEIVEKLEAGIVLTGSEAKSARNGHFSLSGSFVAVLKGELWLVNSNIAPYSDAGYFNHKPVHDRKLLCSRKEIADIKRRTEAKGQTAVPLKAYFKNGRIKIEIGLARGRNTVDKRQSLKNKAIERECGIR